MSSDDIQAQSNPESIEVDSIQPTDQEQLQDHEQDECQQQQAISSAASGVLSDRPLEAQENFEFETGTDEQEPESPSSKSHNITIPIVSLDTATPPGHTLSSTWPMPTWTTSSLSSESSTQEYFSYPSNENVCCSRQPLLEDWIGSWGDKSTVTTNSSILSTGSYVNMQADSEYGNPLQAPQEILHWYRTEKTSGEQDEWEVVEVGLDGAQDNTASPKVPELIDYPGRRWMMNEETQNLQEVVHINREVIGDEVHADTDFYFGVDGASDSEEEG